MDDPNITWRTAMAQSRDEIADFANAAIADGNWDKASAYIDAAAMVDEFFTKVMQQILTLTPDVKPEQ